MAQVNHNNRPTAYGSGELKTTDNKKSTQKDPVCQEIISINILLWK